MGIPTSIVGTKKSWGDRVFVIFDKRKELIKKKRS